MPFEKWPEEEPLEGMAVLATAFLSDDIAPALMAAEYGARRGIGLAQMVVGYVDMPEGLYHQTAGAAMWQLIG